VSEVERDLALWVEAAASDAEAQGRKVDRKWLKRRRVAVLRAIRARQLALKPVVTAWGLLCKLVPW